MYTYYLYLYMQSACILALAWLKPVCQALQLGTSHPIRHVLGHRPTDMTYSMQTLVHWTMVPQNTSVGRWHLGQRCTSSG